MADAAADLRRRIKEKRAAIGRRITDSRDRAAAASSAFNAALLEARSIANQTVSNRAKLSEQKQHLGKLESDLAQVLFVQTSRRSKHKLMTESISNTTSTNEQLRRLVMDHWATRDECTNAISNQLKDIESLEAESDADGDNNLENALMWYDKFLGFQVVGGEGVRFVFNKIDVQSPDKEYSFCVRLVEERYILVRSVPFVDGTEELMKDLNCNNDLYKFVRVMRNRFQAATISGGQLDRYEDADVVDCQDFEKMETNVYWNKGRGVDAGDPKAGAKSSAASWNLLASVKSTNFGVTAFGGLQRCDSDEF